jgi:uncharacterized protein (DUF305 family)
MAMPERVLWIATAAVLTAASALAQAPHRHGGMSAFDRMMAESMDRMDKDMSVPHTGDPDRDFAAMMIPHHQGAIDMAKAELQFGRDAVLRRLAEGIIVEQQQEIELMRRELGRLPSHPRTESH